MSGKLLHVAGALSRASLKSANDQSGVREDIEVMINTLLTNLPVSNEKLIEIRDATAAD